MKILITSDNHLGYKETNEILGNDSFVTFEEILKIAKNNNVDMIIQGGDLFHENNPSKSCINRTVALFKKYVLGDRSISFNSSMPLNNSDTGVNVSIPTIAIHGNHDDPNGINMTSAIDILNSAGLLNYIGKFILSDRIDVHPLLIDGEYKIAIYGLGHIKDRRLFRAFSANNVIFHKPADSELRYNILVVHQNRAVREKEYLPEDFIEEFFDLVIYGHEHQSMVLKNRFLVLQSGSTVRTSLCEGESFDKYAYILHMSETPRLEHIKLKTVRPFVMDNIKIENDVGGAEEILAKKVEDMIEKSNNCGYEDLVANTIAIKDRKLVKTDYPMKKMPQNCENEIFSEKLLPLIRLRVEAPGNMIVNKYQFGLKFKDKVANPSEILSISRKIKKEKMSFHIEEKKIGISEILGNILKGVDLKAVNGESFVSSLNDFVNKGNKEAFSDMIKINIENILNRVSYADVTMGNVGEAIKKASEKMNEAGDNVELCNKAYNIEESDDLMDDGISNVTDCLSTNAADSIIKNKKMKKESNNNLDESTKKMKKESNDFKKESNNNLDESTKKMKKESNDSEKKSLIQTFFEKNKFIKESCNTTSLENHSDTLENINDSLNTTLEEEKNITEEINSLSGDETFTFTKYL